MGTLRHHINYLAAYPEYRRAQWDAADDIRRDCDLSRRLMQLEAEVERLKRRAA
jgi:hypothetical protein